MVYTKVVCYLNLKLANGNEVNHQKIVERIQDAFGKKSVLKLESSLCERVIPQSYSDKKSAGQTFKSEDCPKDLGGE